MNSELPIITAHPVDNKQIYHLVFQRRTRQTRESIKNMFVRSYESRILPLNDNIFSQICEFQLCLKQSVQSCRWKNNIQERFVGFQEYFTEVSVPITTRLFQSVYTTVLKSSNSLTDTKPTLCLVTRVMLLFLFPLLWSPIKMEIFHEMIIYDQHFEVG